MSRASKQAHSGRLPFCAARTGAPATAESLAVSMHLASLTAPPTNFSRSTSPGIMSLDKIRLSCILALVARGAMMPLHKSTTLPPEQAPRPFFAHTVNLFLPAESGRVELSVGQPRHAEFQKRNCTENDERSLNAIE